MRTVLEILWNKIICTNLRIIRALKEEKKRGHEKIFEVIIVENFHNMLKQTETQVQEAQRIAYRINPKRNLARHILIKLTKIKHKEQILKTSREKQ